MKRLKYYFLFILLGSCLNTNSTKNCFDVACTEEFKTISISVKDKNGNPVALDGILVTIIETGDNITRNISDFEFENMRELGEYPIFGDEFSKDYKNKSVKINFKGFDDGQELVNENFTVGADCCHVQLIKGNTNVIIV